ncbi:MAG TPA: 5'/3'-nucleotidase SurE [Arcobacter sp.]|nr:5'/3'-nucleotidase SurE [Arcobacter sp.]
MKKNILITNDDGFDALGLKALIEALRPLANLIVVAPSLNKSACAHSMTLSRPLKFKSVDDDFYRLVDGTPTDCIFLGLHNLYDESNLPDLVVSGINIGSNMGEDITYSGTVAGAMEAVLQGVPAISVSQVLDSKAKEIGDLWDYELAKKSIFDIVSKILEGKFPLDQRKLLNINIPPCSIKECNGIKITKAGHRIYGNDCHRYHDPKGSEFHWIGLHPLLWEQSKEKNCDFEAIKDNYISITPVQLDMTSYSDIEQLNKWI